MASRILTPVLVALVAAPLSALSSSATLRGRAVNRSGEPVAGAAVVVRNPFSTWRVVGQTDASGRFSFPNVPFHEYHVEILAPGFSPWHRDLEIRSTVAAPLTAVLGDLGATVEVAERAGLLESHPATHLDIDRTVIERVPAPLRSRAMEAVLLDTPGFAASDNGRFHFQGSHGQLTFMVDGVPLSDHTHATFSNSLDPAQVESLEVVTGGVAAEFGGKPVAVVNMTTKSGLGASDGPTGEVYLGAAQNATYESGFSVRTGSDTFGAFVTGAASRSDRFLDPVDFRNFHNTGETGRVFARFDWVLGTHDTLRATLTGGRTRRDVVNLASQEAGGMNQRAGTDDFNASLAWTRVLGPAGTLEVAVYGRHAGATLTPTRDLAPGFPEGGPDLPLWARQDRTLGNWGAQASYSRRFGADSTFKAGLAHVAFPLHERFSMAIPSATYVTDPDAPLFAYTSAGGGALWSLDERLTPALSSAYAQTDLHLGDLLLALGLRYDAWTLRGQRDAELQPRLGASYRIEATGTVLRASYDRLLITPDRENLALATSHEAAELGEAHDPGAEPDPGHDHAAHLVRPEIQDAWSVGLAQQFGAWGRLTLDGWRRRSRNTSDVEQFLNTGVEFPIAFAHGFFHGFNVRLDVAPVHGFSGSLSVGHTRARVEGPMVGGLDVHVGEHEHGETGRFPIDHDQKLSAQLALRYDGGRWWAQVTGRHDSGLVAGDPDEAGADPDLAFGLAHVRFDQGDGVWRVEPRTIWNAGLGLRLPLQGRRALTLSADLLNAFDRRTLYNFLSHRGGTHVHPERTWAIRARYAF